MNPRLHNFRIAWQPFAMHCCGMRTIADPDLLEHLFVIAAKINILGAELRGEFGRNLFKIEFVPASIDHDCRKESAGISVRCADLFRGLTLSREFARIRCGKMNCLRCELVSQ